MNRRRAQTGADGSAMLRIALRRTFGRTTCPAKNLPIAARSEPAFGGKTPCS